MGPAVVSGYDRRVQVSGYFVAAYLAGALVTAWVYIERTKSASVIADLILGISVATWPLTWAWALCMLAAESRNKRRARRRP